MFTPVSPAHRAAAAVGGGDGATPLHDAAHTVGLPLPARRDVRGELVRRAAQALGLEDERVWRQEHLVAVAAADDRLLADLLADALDLAFQGPSAATSERSERARWVRNSTANERSVCESGACVKRNVCEAERV